MNQNSCRFCGSTSSKLTSSIFSKDVQALLQWTTIVLAKTSNFPIYICDDCFGKVKSFADFLSMIIETQMKLDRCEPSTNPPVPKFSTNKLGTAPVVVNILKKRGISVSKTKAANNETSKLKNGSQTTHEIQPRLEPEMLNSVIVKEEPMETEACFENYANFDEEFSDEDFGGNLEEKEGDDAYWEEIFKKTGNSGSKPRPSISTSGAFENAKEIAFTCAICKAKFMDFEKLTSHIKARICVYVQPLKCGICHKVFDLRRKFIAHVKNAHHKSGQKPEPKLRCANCRKAFFSDVELRVHMESHIKVVRNDFTFRCMICKAAFTSHLDLIEHMKVHRKKNRVVGGSKAKQKVAATAVSAAVETEMVLVKQEPSD